MSNSEPERNGDWEDSDEFDPQTDAEAQLAAEREAEELRRLAERRYFNVSRSLAASFLFALPLLAIYELGILTDISAVAVWVKAPISWLQRHPIEILGANITIILNVIFFTAMILAAWRLGKLGALHVGTFLGMFMESCLYAILVGPIALFPLVGHFEMGQIVADFSGFWPKVVASCGAGFYEELLFRLLMVGILVFLAKELGRLRTFSAGLLALFVSGVVFSLAHFLSPAESPNYMAFIYRLFAGMIFGVIYLTRGFGIAAWTHALYDVYVLCFLAQ